MPFLIKYWKPLVSVLLISVVLLYLHHKWYGKGYLEGSQAVQKQFDDYRGKIVRVTEQKRLEAAQKLNEVLKTNAEAINVYQSKIDRINADRGRLSRQLQEYYAGTCSRTVPADPDRQEAATASQESSGLSKALDNFVQACRSDAAQLDALISEVNGNIM